MTVEQVTSACTKDATVQTSASLDRTTLHVPSIALAVVEDGLDHTLNKKLISKANTNTSSSRLRKSQKRNNKDLNSDSYKVSVAQASKPEAAQVLDVLA